MQSPRPQLDTEEVALVAGPQARASASQVDVHADPGALPHVRLGLQGYSAGSAKVLDRCTAQVCPEIEPGQGLRTDPQPLPFCLSAPGRCPVPSFYLQIQLLSSFTTSSPCTLPPPPLLMPAKVVSPQSLCPGRAGCCPCSFLDFAVP